MEHVTPLILKVEERRPRAAPVAVVVGAAVAKGAVARNRAKRRVRAILRGMESRYQGFRVVVILRRPALFLSFPELRHTLHMELFKRLAGMEGNLKPQTLSLRDISRRETNSK